MGVVSLLLLGPDGQSVPVPVEDLQPVATAIAEDEEMAAERVLADDLGGQGGEPVERGIFLIPLAAQTVIMNRSRPSQS